MIALRAALLILAAAGGVLAARRSLKLATGLGFVALALVLLKVVLGYIPSAEARLLPWDWYAEVDQWHFEVPAMFLAGAGVWATRKTWWKRDAILVLAGLLVVRAGWLLWETRGSLEGLHGTVGPDGVCLQSSGYSCSAAAAASLLWHHGIEATEREMAELCRTRPGLGGTSECGLMRGLRRKSGGRARIAAPDYPELRTPCIVSIELNALVNHAIVVREARSDGVLAMDPMSGVRFLGRAEFERVWIGSAIWIEK